MQVNLSFGDALLSLAIGALGSLLAAYLYSRGGTWILNITLWWANRSRRAATNRIDKLEAERAQIERLKASPTLMIGWVGSRLAILIGAVTAFLAFDLTMNVDFLQRFMRWRLPVIERPRSCVLLDAFGVPWCLPHEFSTYHLMFVTGIQLVLLFVITRMLYQSLRFMNLDATKTRIDMEIEELKTRWPDE